MKKPLITSIIICITSIVGLGQSVSGVVQNVKGEVLPFATIWLPERNSGSVANEEGAFNLKLPVGVHEIVFRYLGYRPKSERIRIESSGSIVKLVVKLEEQSVSLAEVSVGGLKEDPAIGIMRRMISMAPFHLKELESYTAKAYVKGGGKILSISKMASLLISKKVEAETGIRVGSNYVLESVNSIVYKKPNQISERVISSRNNFPREISGADSPNLRVSQTNFYMPKVWRTMITPFSPSAFQFYNFAYLGSFYQNGQTISKIRVKPKSNSVDLFDGELNVVEDTWSIHSLLLNFENTYGHYTLKQQNVSFKGVWMPVNYEMQATLNLLGIGFNMRYITQIKSYDIQVNSTYLVKPHIIEERVQKSLAKQIDREKIVNPQEALGGELTRKKLKKILKDVAKQEKKEIKQKDPKGIEVESNYEITVDSSAYVKPETYWEAERQVPLTESELVGYKQADSLYQTKIEKIKKDSIADLPRFSMSQLFLPKRFNYEKNRVGHSLSLGFLRIGFNPVDGYSLAREFDYQYVYGPQNNLKFMFVPRYSFARKALNPTFNLIRVFDENRQKFQVGFGSSINQINSNAYIPVSYNMVSALFFGENQHKLYQKNFIQVSYDYQLNAKFKLFSTIEYRRRFPLENQVFFGINKDYPPFESNFPIVDSYGDTRFKVHNQLFSHLGITWSPKSTWRKVNGRLLLNRRDEDLNFNLSSEFTTGQYSFARLQFKINQTVDLQRLGKLTYRFIYNDFLKKPVNILDFTHFETNGTYLLGQNDLAFRMLPLYQFSTSNEHAELHVKWEPRKFILSQVPLLYMYGIRENLTYGQLIFHSDRFKSGYHEVSYGVNGIMGVFGFDVVHSFGNNSSNAWKLMLRVPF